MNDKKYFVYKHTAPNGKVYIGITSQSKVYYRWHCGKGYRNSPYFYNAILKYGWSNFKHEVLYSKLRPEKAYKLEQKLIKKYKSNNRKYGYNNSIGGEKSAYGCKLSDKTRKRISNATKGENNPFYNRHHSEETKKIISEKAKKRPGPNKGRIFGPMSDEEKLKRSIANKGNQKLITSLTGRKLSKEHIKNSAEGHYKKVRCVETNIVYNSIKEASKILRIDNASIVKACKGEREKAAGYHWKYVDDDKLIFKA